MLVLRSGKAPDQLPWSEVTIRNETPGSHSDGEFRQQGDRSGPVKIGAIVSGGEVTVKARPKARTARTAPPGSLFVIGGKDLIRIAITIDPPSVRSWQLTTYFGWPIGQAFRPRRQATERNSRVWTRCHTPSSTTSSDTSKWRSETTPWIESATEPTRASSLGLSNFNS